MIATLAEQFHRPVETVQDLYVHELELLTPTARIKDYLVLLAGRTVREHLADEASRDADAVAGRWRPVRSEPR